MEKELTVLGHLDELRRRIILVLISVAFTTCISIPFASDILKILKYPTGGAIGSLAFFSPEEAFLVYMRISFTSGLIMASPFIIFQIWAFLSPAIEGNLRRSYRMFAVISSAIFIIGCAFSYFVLLPAALKFLLSIGEGELEPVISATKYISFVTYLIIACGIVFEMPVASFFLTKTGIINARLLRKKFKYAVIVIAVAAAVITPTGDVFNMLALAVPMLFLYEVSVWISHISGKREIK